jgi:excinuclease ABC subunit A
MDLIRIRGARTHNLKNVSLDLPRGKLTVITGLSGSGKSSLAFDTLYAEGQRRYVESLSAYARQFLQLMEKPDVDMIEGLSPAIAIEQKTAGHNPRSTVGTITEVHDYLRLLYARVGEPHCPDHGVPLSAKTVSQVVDAVLAFPAEARIMVLAPVVAQRKGEHVELLEDFRARGFVRVRIDGEVLELDPPPKLAKTRVHDVDVVIDRLRVRPDAAQRLAESVETAMRLSDGKVAVVDLDAGTEHAYSSRFACPQCDYALTELEPRLFSFNNPAGACGHCDGLGVVNFFDPARIVAFPHLSLAAGAVKGWDRRNAFYFQLLRNLATHAGFDVDTPFEDLPEAAKQLVLHGSGDETIRFTYEGERGKPVIKEHVFEGIVPNIARRYGETESQLVREELAQYRTSADLPGMPRRAAEPQRAQRLHRRTRAARDHGDAARRRDGVVRRARPARCARRDRRPHPARDPRAARLPRERRARLPVARAVGRHALGRRVAAHPAREPDRDGLTGVMYVLDEPSIGLHQRDNDRLLETLVRLRDLGNTVIVVEHDRDAILRADHLVDMGPGAGVHGGQVIAAGTPAEVTADPASVTGQYLSGARRIETPAKRLPPDPDKQIVIRGARGNNLGGVDVAIPLGRFVCVTGVSGSGKSTLVNDTLHVAAARHLHGSREEPAPHDAIEGLDRSTRS